MDGAGYARTFRAVIDGMARLAGSCRISGLRFRILVAIAARRHQGPFRFGAALSVAAVLAGIFRYPRAGALCALSQLFVDAGLDVVVPAAAVQMAGAQDDVWTGTGHVAAGAAGG